MQCNQHIRAADFYWAARAGWKKKVYKIHTVEEDRFLSQVYIQSLKIIQFSVSKLTSLLRK